MKHFAVVSLLSLATLACPSTPPPVEPVPEGTSEPVPTAPDTVEGALGGHEGAFAVAGEMHMAPDQPSVAFTGTIQQWFGDDGLFYMVYDQAASEAAGPGMQGWGKMWADETGAAHMWWTDSMMPGVSMEFTGPVAADGTMTMDGTGPGPDGSPTHYRATYRLPEGGVDEFEMGVVLPDETYRMVMKYTTTRTGDAVKTWAPPAPAETPAQTPAENPPAVTTP